MAVFALIAPTTSLAQTSDVMTPEIRQAVDEAITWLVDRQQPDGSFGSGSLQGDPGVTAIAAMALIAGGSTVDRGPHGKAVARAIDYLVKSSQPSGFIQPTSSRSTRPMYGHGFATMVLAEAYGMPVREDLRERLDAAVRLIVTAQNEEGGWRYQPRPEEADISVTVCQLMALRAARNAGLYVPSDTVDRAVAYVRRCQNEDGGFAYQLLGGDSQFARSAAAVVALHSAGVYEGAEIDRAMAYLDRFPPGSEAVLQSPYFFYGQYYMALAMWQLGDERFRAWYTPAAAELLRLRNADGTWESPICDQYATAMALIVLQLPNDYLPISQR